MPEPLPRPPPGYLYGPGLRDDAGRVFTEFTDKTVGYLLGPGLRPRRISSCPVVGTPYPCQAQLQSLTVPTPDCAGYFAAGAIHKNEHSCDQNTDELIPCKHGLASKQSARCERHKVP
jgi:hypothetical protein